MTSGSLPPLQQSSLISIGIDKRWFAAQPDQLVESAIAAFEGRAEAAPEQIESAVAKATICIDSAKQNAIKRHIATGLLNLEKGLRDGVVDLEADDAGFVQRIASSLGKSSGQSRRYLAALDLAVDQETIETTVLLESSNIRSPRTQVRNFRAESLLQLAIGYGASLEQLMPSPYEFIANTTSLMLRMSVDRVSITEKSGEAYLRTKRSFPSLPWGGAVQPSSSYETLSPIARMALYGLYIWLSPLLCVPRNPPIHDDTLRNVFFYAANHVKWIFPELIGKQQLADLYLSNPRYALDIKQAVEQVGLAVGKMLLSFPPYTKAQT